MTVSFSAATIVRSVLRATAVVVVFSACVLPGVSSRPAANPVAVSATPTPVSRPPAEALGTQMGPGARGPVTLDVASHFRIGKLSQPRTLTVPAGFRVNVFASRLNGPRFMAAGPADVVFVTGMADGQVYALPDRNRDGVADAVLVWVDGLRQPHGIVYRDGYLYVGEAHRLIRFRVGSDGSRQSAPEVVIPDLPTGGNHFTRTIGIGPDGRIFVAAGSTCDVCDEQDARRAAISVYNGDGSNGRIYMRGLRNAVGVVWRPGTNEIWATNNGRDELGDDLPAESIYRVRDGANAGWPRCIPVPGGIRIDPQFGRPDSCQGVDAPAATMQAHTAPLGLRFYDGTQFPVAYRGDLFVALHGSWNRTAPAGYKVVRIPIDGDNAGDAEDFVTGWMPNEGNPAGIWGRPVDILIAPDGAMLVSDDSDGGTIYRVSYVVR